MTLPISVPEERFLKEREDRSSAFGNVHSLPRLKITLLWARVFGRR